MCRCTPSHMLPLHGMLSHVSVCVCVCLPRAPFFFMQVHISAPQSADFVLCCGFSAKYFRVTFNPKRHFTSIKCPFFIRASSKYKSLRSWQCLSVRWTHYHLFVSNVAQGLQSCSKHFVFLSYKLRCSQFTKMFYFSC